MFAASSMSDGLSSAAVLSDTLSAPARKQRVDVVERAYTAADGQRDEDPIRRASHHVEQDGALIAGRGDVEKDELVRAVLVVSGGQLGWISGVAQIDERNALDHPPGGDVETRDHPLGERHETGLATARSAAARSIRPSYSALPTMTPAAPAAAARGDVVEAADAAGHVHGAGVDRRGTAADPRDRGRP